MSSFQHIFKRIFHKYNYLPNLYSQRMLTYTSVYYDGKTDPAPFFFNDEVQSILKLLTRVDYNKVFRKKKLGRDQLKDPEYKFMTDDELKAALEKARRRAEVLLQIPPIVKIREPISKVLSKDPALEGLDTSKLVFTDITFGINNLDRIIVVREPNGTLQEADWDTRKRINQVYFPTKERSIKLPIMFQDNYLESLLERYEYEYVLDRACIQFEPDEPEFQKIASITYQHLNDKSKFDLLRSTRHFGGLVFFLVWNKNIDNLLLDLIGTSHINEAGKLISLYSQIHQIQFEGSDDLGVLEDFVKQVASKKGGLELAIQAYKEIASEQKALEKGIKSAHGITE